MSLNDKIRERLKDVVNAGAERGNQRLQLAREREKLITQKIKSRNTKEKKKLSKSIATLEGRINALGNINFDVTRELAKDEEYSEIYRTFLVQPSEANIEPINDAMISNAVEFLGELNHKYKSADTKIIFKVEFNGETRTLSKIFGDRLINLRNYRELIMSNMNKEKYYELLKSKDRQLTTRRRKMYRQAEELAKKELISLILEELSLFSQSANTNEVLITGFSVIADQSINQSLEDIRLYNTCPKNYLYDNYITKSLYLPDQCLKESIAYCIDEQEKGSLIRLFEEEYFPPNRVGVGVTKGRRAYWQKFCNEFILSFSKQAQKYIDSGDAMGALKTISEETSYNFCLYMFDLQVVFVFENGLISQVRLDGIADRCEENFIGEAKREFPNYSWIFGGVDHCGPSTVDICLSHYYDFHVETQNPPSEDELMENAMKWINKENYSLIDPPPQPERVIISMKKGKDKTKLYSILVFDIESFSEEKSIPYLLRFVYLEESDPGVMFEMDKGSFQGLGCVSQFLDYITRLRSKNEILLVAHYGGCFDFLFLLPELLDADITPTIFGTISNIKTGSFRIEHINSKGKKKKQKFTFFDTFKVMSRSLNDIAKSFLGIEGKENFDVRSVNRDNYLEKMIEADKYCEQDVNILVEFIKKWRECMLAMGLTKLFPTSSGIGFDMLRSTIRSKKDEVVNSPAEVTYFERKSYSGGYTQLFSNGAYPFDTNKKGPLRYFNENYNMFNKSNKFVCARDINSSYPAVMVQEEMPFKFQKAFSVNWDLTKLKKQKIVKHNLYLISSYSFQEGFAYPNFFFKDKHYTYCPRSASSENYFAVWGIELIRAIPNLESIEVKKEFCYSSKKVFSEVSQSTYDNRIKAGKNSPLGLSNKTAGNSIYGSTGRNRKPIISFMTLSDIVKTRNLTNTKIIDATPLDDVWYFVESYNYHYDYDDRGLAVRFASYITACGRDRLFEALSFIPPALVLYCDTDSIFYVIENGKDYFPEHLCGNNLGQFSIEKVGDFFLGAAPKLYLLGNYWDWIPLVIPENEEDQISLTKYVMTNYFVGGKLGAKGISRGSRNKCKEEFFLTLLNAENGVKMEGAKSQCRRKYDSIVFEEKTLLLRRTQNKVFFFEDGTSRPFHSVEEAREIQKSFLQK